LLFYHIGRTGGTSLTKYFRSLTSKSYIQPEPADGSGLESSEPFDFISGHYPVALWTHRVPRSWRTMMVIRNPVSHLLSSYWHIRTHPEATDNDGLRDLIANARRDDLGTLLQARAGAQFEAYFDNPQTRFILDKTTGPLDADDQAHAIALLNSLTYVGTTERLDDFAAAVAAVTPWAGGWEEQTLPRAMVNPLNVLRIDEVPRDLLRRILAATEIDAALHQCAAAWQSARFDPFTRATTPRREGSSYEVRFIPVTDAIRVLPRHGPARPGHRHQRGGESDGPVEPGHDGAQRQHGALCMGVMLAAKGLFRDRPHDVDRQQKGRYQTVAASDVEPVQVFRRMA
jgi:hypothetical protein